MRHVTVRLASASEIREGIREPDRFRPRPRVLRIPPVRERDDGAHEIKLNDEDGWRKIHPMIVALHGTLEPGAPCDVAAMTEVVVPLLPKPNRAVAEAVTRSFLYSLYSEDYVAIDFEPPPDVFAQRYERVRELGRGGMGIAHLCRDRATGQLVVVKHAWGWSRPVEKADATNRKEAAVLARLDHPRIPPVIDAFEHEGLFHMVRPFVEGVPLGKLRPRPWERPLADRVAIVRSLAETVQYVHDTGHLYLDMKPSNAIIRSVEEGAFLLDFGVCRTMEDGLVRTRGIVGSKGYIGPEMKQRMATVRTDIFALGRTWYNLASGRKPRQGRTLDEFRSRMAAAGVQPREMDAIVRLIEPDPAARPASMREVVHLLDGLV